MGLLERAREQSSNVAVVEEHLRRRAQEIVRAYRHSWDVYSEPLQNSVDAINRRHRSLNTPDSPHYTNVRATYANVEPDPTYRGRIEIEVDPTDNEIVIRDNGVGILPDRIEEFLLPEGTDKEVGQEYGFKGFGLAYLAFISTEISIKSRHFLAGGLYGTRIIGLFDWLASDSEGHPFPESAVSELPADELDRNWSTEVRVKLARDYAARFPAISAVDTAFTLVRDLDTLKGFEYLLRSRTAVGNTQVLFNRSPVVAVDVQLVAHTADGLQAANIPYRYYVPWENSELEAFSYTFSEYMGRYLDPGFSRGFRALHHTRTALDVGARRPVRCDFLIAAVSQQRLSNIEERLQLTEMESADVDITYGVHLAIDGMPTGLRIDDWDTKSPYFRRFFVVVNAGLGLSDQLDAGRKGISRYFARQISNKALQLIQQERVGESAPLSKYAATELDHGRSPGTGGLPPQDFQDEVQRARDGGVADEQNNPLLLRAIRSVSHLSFAPQDEQEVIALFFELLNKGVIKGYRAVYLAGSRSVYDAAFEYKIEATRENCFPHDPLGVGQVLVEQLHARGLTEYDHRRHHAQLTALPELCVEFKRSVGGLLEELQNRRSAKSAGAIDLLVTWDLTVPSSVNERLYTLDPVDPRQRRFHGVTHRLGYTGEENTEVACIVLRDVIDIFLKDSATVGYV